ncbi:hypothetical protein Tco_0617862 [Tanacetum coccineum]
MLGKEPNKVYDPSLKAGLGYKNPERLKKTIAAQPKIYDGEMLHSTSLKIDSLDFEETLEDAKESRLKMRNKTVCFSAENSAVFIARKIQRAVGGGPGGLSWSWRNIHDIIKKGIGWLMRGCIIRGKSAFGRDGEEDFVMGEGVVVSSSSLERSIKSCFGGIMVSLIFLEGLEEEACVDVMEEKEK